MIALSQRPQTVQAIGRLLELSKADFEEVLDWIRASREDQRDTNECLNGNDMYRGAGRALNMTELLDAIEVAPEILERLRRDALGISTESM